MRAPGMTWFRLPLFVWSNYATSLIQVLGTPVIAVTIVLLFCERVFHIGIFDPGARRRPGAVPAPVLVLLASGGVHHGAAGHGRDQRTGFGVLAQAGVRLRLRGVLERRDRGARLPGVGPSPVRQHAVGVCGNGLLVPELLRRDSVGHQGLQLDGDACTRARSPTPRRCCTRSASSACSRSAA